MVLQPKTVFCYECRKGFRTANGARSHGRAKQHQWQTPAGAVVSISVPTAPSGLATELSSQVVTLAAHVQGEQVVSQFVYCPLCARRWGTWFELNRHYIEAHPVDPALNLKDVLRSQCTSPGPLVIEDDDEGPAEAYVAVGVPAHVASPHVQRPDNRAPDVEAQSIIVPDTPVLLDDATLVEEPVPTVLMYPAAELAAEHAESIQGDAAVQESSIAMSTGASGPTLAKVIKAIKKSKKAAKVAKDATKAETRATKKAAKAIAQAEKKTKKAAERAAREESSKAAGIDSIDAIKDQIANLKKTQQLLSRGTTQVIDKLTTFHDGVLSLQQSGACNVLTSGPPAPVSFTAGSTEQIDDMPMHLTDEQLLYICAVRHGVDVSSRIRDLLAAATPFDGCQPESGDTEDVPSPGSSSPPKSLADSWEKAIFEELSGCRDNAEDFQESHGAGGSSLRCRLCLKEFCDEPVATPCGHIFCHRCIGQELVVHTKCPVCQRAVLQRLALD